MPDIDNWRALREALDALRRIESLHDCDWQSREGDVNEWGTQCYEIDCVFYGVDELATAYDPETAAYIAAAHPAAIRSLLDERDRLAAEVEALRADAGRKPLTDAQIESGREATFSTGNPFCPCDSKTMRKAVRWAEAKHGITDAAMKGKP